jgi:hypothetical protein
MRRYHEDEFEDAYFRQISANVSQGRYRFIGKGSGRAVYDLGNGQVVKAAKNIKGLAQNREEFRISALDSSGLFARVFSVSDDYRYLIMDKADQIADISYVWNYFHVNSNKELYNVRKLWDIADKYNLLIRDLGRSVNWGHINGKPVIIDYGFTRQVRIKYY